MRTTCRRAGPTSRAASGTRATGFPPEFRDRQYVIDDWRGYHLSPPPRGYQWVGVGGDHLLVQIGSGIVLRIGG